MYILPIEQPNCIIYSLFRTSVCLSVPSQTTTPYSHLGETKIVLFLMSCSLHINIQLSSGPKQNLHLYLKRTSPYSVLSRMGSSFIHFHLTLSYDWLYLMEHKLHVNVYTNHRNENSVQFVSVYHHVTICRWVAFLVLFQRTIMHIKIIWMVLLHVVNLRLIIDEQTPPVFASRNYNLRHTIKFRIVFVIHPLLLTNN